MAELVLMPQMGVSEESALLAAWLVSEGDTIQKEQALFSLETGKSSFEELSKHEGVLLKILVPAGEEVAVGAPVGVIGQPGEKWEESVAAVSSAGAASPASRKEESADEKKASSAGTVEKEGTGVSASHSSSGESSAEAPGKKGIGVSPRARNLAAELGLDPAMASASGPEGRVIERDIVKLASSVSCAAEPQDAERQKEGASAVSSGSTVSAVSASASPEKAAAYEDKPISRIRKVIAENMHRSLSSMAQLTLNASFDALRILAMRAEMKASEGYGLEKVTLNDFVLYAVARTLPEFPDLNANFTGETMRYYRHAQLGVAVDTPRGLMVPVLRDADLLSLRTISEQVKLKAKQCRDGAVDPAEFAGGSFTVSNLGAFGVESFTPVINPPQTAILGVCSIRQTPRARADGKVEFYPAMGLSLTFDHRAVDGAPAARFLKTLSERLEHFHLLLAQ